MTRHPPPKEAVMVMVTAPKGSAAARIIAAAKAEVGYREGRSSTGRANNIQRYSPAVVGLEWSQGQPWCATFVAWLAMRTGLAGLYPKTASCDVGGDWFKTRNRWSEYPAVGAQVFFGYPHDLNHTGLVYAYDETYIYTVEGNTNADGSREGDGVYLKKRARRGANVIGYGYPDFGDGILISADPAWQKQAATPAPKPVPVPKAKKPTRITKARDLLEVALTRATPGSRRAKKIQTALDALPKR